HLVGDVDPDLIEQRNWTDWKPKLDEGPIDLFNRHTLAQDEQRLIQVRRKHPRCVKPRAVTHDDHCLALIFSKLYRCSNNPRGSPKGGDYFQKWHAVHR